MNLYKGFVSCEGKKPMMKFANVPAEKLLTLEQAKCFPSYAGVLDKNTVLIDVDNKQEGSLLYEIVKDKKLKCKVYETDNGYHFLFRSNQPMKCRTHIKLAIGITADIKSGSTNALQALRVNGVDRNLVYNSEDCELIPKYLMPIRTNMNLLNMAEGDGRNSALYSYILPLRDNGFTVEECRECIGLINKYILKEPLPDEELAVIVRDGAFTKPNFIGERNIFHFDKFAKFMVDNDNIIKLNGKLYIYRDGIYECGDDYIEAAMIEHIPNLNMAKRKEVLAYLNLLIKKDIKVSDANLIAFKNGVLDITNGELHNFSPDYIITNKIPHNYNPDATNELLDVTMTKLSGGDESVKKLLYQSIGYCFYRRNELRKSFFLLGEKRNGKSTFLDMVGTLLGENNTSNLDICEIGDRFRTAELTGKLANIGDDINDEWVSNTAIFKKVVSGDIITVERKGKDPFKLRSFAKFFFSANSLPRLGRGRDSRAVLDRLVIIPFDAQFTKADADYDPFIKYKLRDEAVMEALIAKAIPALIEVLSNQEFETCSKLDATLVDFEKSNNPILEFFDEIEEIDYVNEPIKKVYQTYNTFCLSNNLQALSALEFQKQMKSYFGLVIKNVVDRNGKKVRVYQYE